MDNYFNTFKDITQSIDSLLNDEHKSIEIEQSAISLSETVKPCIAELKSWAFQLRQLILACFEQLYHAENIWLSKPRIAQASKSQIWEQVGEISGRSIIICQLASQCKNEAVKQARGFWDQQIESTRKKWFIDAKGDFQAMLARNQKASFINAIDILINSLDREVNKIIGESLTQLYIEMPNLYSEILQQHLSLLDEQNRAKLSHKIDLIIEQIETEFADPINYLPSNVPRLNVDISVSSIAILQRDLFHIISWDDVILFKVKVLSKIDNYITAILDDKIELAAEAIEKAIAFYNDFLEQQERYQQETPEQREAEKAWIDEQRQKLTQMQDGIEVILNAG